MATQTRIELIDDVDGGRADETVGFAMDGVTYEIDLKSTNAAALRESLNPYLEKARRLGGKRTTSTKNGHRPAPKAPTAKASTAPPVEEPALEEGLEEAPDVTDVNPPPVQEVDDAQAAPAPSPGPVMHTTVLPTVWPKLTAGDRASLKKFARRTGQKVPGDFGRVSQKLREAWMAAGSPR